MDLNKIIRYLLAIKEKSILGIKFILNQFILRPLLIFFLENQTDNKIQLIKNKLEVRFKIFKSFKVSFYGDQADNKIKLIKNQDLTSFRPIRLNFPNKKINYPSSDLSLFTFNNVLASAHTNALIKGDFFLVPEYIYYKNISDLSILYHSTFFFINSEGNTFCSIRHKKAKENINKAILIGGQGSENWYHFSIEYLPKLFIINNYTSLNSDISIIVPDTYNENNSFREALSLFSKNRNIVYLKSNEFVRCKKLYCLSDFNITPFNLPKGQWPKLEQFSINSKIVKEYSNSLISSINISQNFIHKKLFLIRNEKRRSFNQYQLLSIAKKYGYVGISLEKYSFKEQVKIISNVKNLIGASGAAWTSMLYSKNSLKCLSWLPKEYFNFSTYSSLADSLGHYLFFIECYPDQILKTTAQAYYQSYKVSPVEFENALIKLEKIYI